MELRNFITFASICVILAGTAHAQSFYSLRTDRSVIAVVGLNSSTYYGDLKDYSDFIDVKPSLSLGLMGAMTPKTSIRAEFSWITLSGRDLPDAGTGRAGRNLSFSSNNYEFSVSGIFRMKREKGRFYQRPNFNAYGFLGVGGLYFNPKATLDGREYALQPLQTEGVKYSRLTFVIPFGLGAKIKLTPFANLALEAGWRKTFTDYIDDVSTVHLDVNAISDPVRRQLSDRRPELNLPAVRAGNKRGNPKAKDGYMLLSAKIEYYLPYQLGQNRKLYRAKRRPIYR